MTHKILVVDDEPDLESLVLQKFRSQIRNKEIDFVFASNGLQALEVLQQNSEIDVILSDINMPQMDGLELLNRLQGISYLQKTVMISAYGDIENVRVAMNRGAFDFVVKPIDFSDLEITIKKALNEIIKTKEAAEVKTHLEKERREKEELIINQNSVLEKKVMERTLEVNSQKQLIEEKHREITDSIFYAERIQKSFLPSSSFLKENLGDYFVFFKPKDVVSGDFYWATKLYNGLFALVTADSTGHGVPGAIMSMVNYSILKGIVEVDKVVEPNQILNHARQKVIQTLANDGSEEGGKDGMDCSVISFDFENKTLIYSAAHNPIIIIRKGELIELAPDKMPIGKHDHDHISFKQHEYAIHENDMIYTLTDGLPDQFGGPKGKKFMYKRLKDLLISIAHLKPEVQNSVIEKQFNEWKGSLEQVDDITLIGIRVS